MIEFVIPIAPRTKKNSQQIIYKNVGGKKVPMIIPSKLYRQYEKDCEHYIPRLHIKDRINIKSIYYMPTRRRVDLINLHEALHDILVKYECIDDDNCSIVYSTDGSCVKYDKDNPRSEVSIEWLD